MTTRASQPEPRGNEPGTDRRDVRAARLRGFGPSIFTEITRLAAEHGAVNLGQGYPDFPGPEFVKQAAIRAITSDHNQYARSSGEPALVSAIARSLKRTTGLDYDPMTEITVTSGATEALHCALLAFCEPGDEVVMLEPFYDSYPAGCALAGAIPRMVPLHGPHFRWDPRELAGAFNSRTRLLLLNTPHNPTGRVLSEEEMGELASLCLRHDVLCLADEVYEKLVYEGRHLSMASLPGMRDRTVRVSSTGKTFSLTGWKVGYAAAPPELSRALAAVHQFVTFSTGTPFQHAMATALEAPEEYYFEFRQAYRARRDLLIDELRGCGFAVEPPQGSYFILADIRSLGAEDGPDFCRRLITEAGVAALPASAFYADQEKGRPLVRFAFCKRRETLEEAGRRLRARFRRE